MKSKIKTNFLTAVEFFTGKKHQPLKRYEVKPFRAKPKKVKLPSYMQTFKEFRGTYNG